MISKKEKKIKDKEFFEKVLKELEIHKKVWLKFKNN